tara:strand:+ start:7496 stop:8467 length:972 start_codon:yes stop_codon:yes gene_type:complete
MISNPISTIDLEPLWGKSQGVYEVAEQLKQSFKTLGFAYIKNHHIPSQLLADMFTVAEKFHALPRDIKMRIVQNKTFRGFLPANESQVKISTEGASTRPNFSEAFIMMFDADESHPDFATGDYLAGPNQWLDDMPELKETMCAYRDAMVALGFKLLEAFSVAFGLEPTALHHFFSDPTYFLRLHKYPPQPANAPADQFGVAPHTDIGFMTLVAQDDVGGLEVRHPEKGWLAVPYVPDTFVLNAGDMLHRWTGGTFASSPHRVLNNHSGKTRYSVPFFFDPNMHTQIETLSTCIASGNGKTFPPIMYGDYVMNRVTKNYSRLKM